SNVQRGIGREEGPVMKTVYLASRWLGWVLGAVGAACGVMFWTGHGLSVYKPALLIGAVVGLSLGLLAATGRRAGAAPGVVHAGPPFTLAVGPASPIAGRGGRTVVVGVRVPPLSRCGSDHLPVCSTPVRYCASGFQ